MDKRRSQLLLHHRRRREPRGPDLGGGRLSSSISELTSVISIFNCNDLAQSDWVSPQQSAETVLTRKKLEAFGFFVHRHRRPRSRARSWQRLPAKLQRSQERLQAALAIVARTVKGWGAQRRTRHGQARGGREEAEHMQRGASPNSTIPRPGVGSRRPSVRHHQRTDHPARYREARKLPRLRLVDSHQARPPFLEGHRHGRSSTRTYTAGKPIAHAQGIQRRAIVALGKAERAQSSRLDADMKNSTIHRVVRASSFPSPVHRVPALPSRT